MVEVDSITVKIEGVAMTFRVGQITRLGKILRFEQRGEDWMVITDDPSEWQRKSGMKEGWCMATDLIRL